MKVHKEPRNAIGNCHGYQEWYRGTTIYFRANLSNGKMIGYYEIHKVGDGIFISKSETKFVIR